MNAHSRFGRFELNPTTRQLLADGKSVVLGVRACDVQLALVERRERWITRNALLDLGWPGLLMEEGNIRMRVSTLRKRLGQRAMPP